MMLMLFTAFVMGAVGSLHCIGMCGPLALSLPVVAPQPFARFLYTLLYNLGRVVTYAAMGAVFGIIGLSFAIAGFQQVLSIGLGVAILLYIAWPGKWLFLKGSGFMQKHFTNLRARLAALFQQKNYQSLFFIGLLNGLLPCGLLYLALAAAVSTGSSLKSSFFMAAFGLGTLPLMWTLSFFGSLAGNSTRKKLKLIYPYMMAFVACLLIMRGAGFQMPYLEAGGSKAVVVECYEPF